jgi:hypothetical protein
MPHQHHLDLGLGRDDGIEDRNGRPTREAPDVLHALPLQALDQRLAAFQLGRRRHHFHRPRAGSGRFLPSFGLLSTHGTPRIQLVEDKSSTQRADGNTIMDDFKANVVTCIRTKTS